MRRSHVVALLVALLLAAVTGGHTLATADGSTLATSERVQVTATGKQGTVVAALDAQHVVVAFDGSAAPVLSYPADELQVPPPPPTSFNGYADTAPDGTQRPYSDLSPFNQPVPASPTVVGSSSQLVAGALQWSGGKPSALSTSRPASSDWSHPVYFARSTDPLLTIEAGTNYKLTGVEIHVPAGARAAGGGDGHMAIVQPDGWEYDFWKAKPDGLLLPAAIAYRQRYDGLGIVTPAMLKSDPLLGGTTASYFGLHAGMIRASELAAGRIDHALFLVIKAGTTSTSFVPGTLAPGANGRGGAGASVYPAFKGDSVSSGTLPPMGARFWLAMTPAEIDATTAPSWEKTVAKAVATYGAYMGDTGGAGFSFMAESSLMYTSLGKPDPFDPIAQSFGIAKDPTYGYVFRFGTGTKPIPWASRLRVIAPPTP